MLERKQYTSDMTDAEWVKIEPLLPPEKPVGEGNVLEMLLRGSESAEMRE